MDTRDPAQAEAFSFVRKFQAEHESVGPTSAEVESHLRHTMGASRGTTGSALSRLCDRGKLAYTASHTYVEIAPRRRYPDRLRPGEGEEKAEAVLARAHSLTAEEVAGEGEFPSVASARAALQALRRRGRAVSAWGNRGGRRVMVWDLVVVEVDHEERETDTKEEPMSMSTRVLGIVKGDDEWRRMKDVWDACQAAKVEVPREVEHYFRGYSPQVEGVEVDVRPAVTRDTSQNARDRWVVDLSKLPPGVVVLVFENSW